MKTIKFNEAELEFLQHHYELELLDAENYVGEIKNILKKLGVMEKTVLTEKPVKKTGKKPGRPKKVKKEAGEKATSKKVIEAKPQPAKAVKAPPVKKTEPKAKPGNKAVKKTLKKKAKTVKPVAVVSAAQPGSSIS
jgi:hypothetical protein